MISCPFVSLLLVENGPTLSICATLAYPSRPRFTHVSASPNLWLFSFTTDGSVCRRDLRQPLIPPLMRFRMQKPIHQCVKAIPLSILHSIVDLHHITHIAPVHGHDRHSAVSAAVQDSQIPRPYVGLVPLAGLKPAKTLIKGHSLNRGVRLIPPQRPLNGLPLPSSYSQIS